LKLSRLIELHRQNLNAQDLADNFGDGFLVKNNRIYGKIRAAALQSGYRFSSDQNNDYSALPFAQLENILGSKTVPYTNNVTVIEKLVKQLKDNVIWDDIADGLRKNFVFHEGCHAVARSIASSGAVHDPKAKAFRILMEESFANTCEFLAVADAEDAGHRIFFEANSYTALFEQKKNIANAIRDSGFPTVFKIMWLAYLHSNYLHEHLDEKQWRQCLAMAELESLPASQLKALKSLSRIAFTLDPRFRLVTTGFHLKLNGISMSPQEIVNFKILEMDSLKSFLNSACQVLQ
jgi:hypothetical protein